MILKAHLFCVLLVSRIVLKTIQHRKHNWTGHTIRNENYLNDTVEGKMMGKTVVVGKGQNYYDLTGNRIAQCSIRQKSMKSGHKRKSVMNSLETAEDQLR